MSRPPLPPGTPSRIAADNVLVLAPHFDDEVLGCGGLLAQLAAAGAAVRVLFLSDGADSGVEDPAERAAYGRRRIAEAGEALEALGLEWADRLGLPDGRLERNLDALVAGIGKAIAAHQPELVLVPSPLEVTGDHRAAFAALHRVLAPLGRSDAPADDRLEQAARRLRVLAYEINHPGYPDVLVDVSDEVGRIEAAMACYESQQDRHDYLAAGLGLRRYRTLSLPTGIAAAEGYRRLAVSDFTTRSPAQLVRHLGGVPELVAVEEGPRVSVVVRTRDRPELLAEALASLAESTYRRAEVVVVNDGGRRPELPGDHPLPIRLVDLEESRGRAGAANAGVAAAEGDWIGFLDDDDRVAPEHLAVLAAAAAAPGVRAVYTDAAVVVSELAGADDRDGDGRAAEPEAAGWIEIERRLPYSRDFDLDLLLVDNYIPFNTVVVERALVDEVAAEAGGEPFDPELPIFEDWDFLIRVGRRAPLAHLRRVTAEYRHFRGAGHHALGERPRERADFLAIKERVLAKHAGALGPGRLARAIDALRAEAVELAERAGGARREAAEARERAAELGARHAALAAERAELEVRYHRLNGEADAVRRDRDRLLGEAGKSSAELARLYAEEASLRATVAEQEAHLGRTYGEISRLNGIVDGLRGASLPGLVRWWRRERRR